MTTVAIIDGDVVAYMACKHRRPMKNGYVQYIPKGEPEHVFTAEEDEQYLDECWNNFVEITLDLKEVCNADYFLMAVSGNNNFRDDLYPDYKANRRANPEKRNTFVPKLRTMAAQEGIAIRAHGREADDCLRIWAEESRKAEIDFVVCSIDKDLKLIHGRHYVMNHNVLITVTKEYATRFYYEQLLKGDPTDNIKGIPRVGDAKAKALLEPYETEPEFQAVVIEAYKDYYGKDWREYLLGNGKLIYLQKTPTDYFNIRGWSQFAEELAVEET